MGVFFHHDDASSFHHIYIYIKSSQSELYTLSVSVYVYIHNQIWEPDLAFVSNPRDFFCARERFSSLLCCVLFFFFFFFLFLFKLGEEIGIILDLYARTRAQ